MTEDEARLWLAAAVSRETLARMERFEGLIRGGAREQNLVSRATLAQIWARHFVDSAQLRPLIGVRPLLDIGSGAGFPGLVLAMLTEAPVTLAEPRRLRAGFLVETATALGLDNVMVDQRRVEMIVSTPYAAIVARAVAPLAGLFAMAEHLGDRATRWVLAKGRSAQTELAEARETWHGDFELVNSVSDAQAAIIVATDVRRKVKRGRGR